MKFGIVVRPVSVQMGARKDAWEMLQDVLKQKWKQSTNYVTAPLKGIGVKDIIIIMIMFKRFLVRMATF